MSEAEVDLDAGVDGELRVFGHLRALVPGKRAAKLGGKRWDLLGHGRANRLGGVPMGEGKEHDVPRRTLHQRPDSRHTPAKDEVALPVPGHGPVLHLGGTFGDLICPWPKPPLVRAFGRRRARPLRRHWCSSRRSAPRPWTNRDM